MFHALGQHVSKKNLVPKGSLTVTLNWSNDSANEECVGNVVWRHVWGWVFKFHISKFLGSNPGYEGLLTWRFTTTSPIHSGKYSNSIIFPRTVPVHNLPNSLSFYCSTHKYKVTELQEYLKKTKQQSSGNCITYTALQESLNNLKINLIYTVYPRQSCRNN